MSSVSVEAQLRAKAINLFKYLKDISELKGKAIRSIDSTSYVEKIFLYEIPKENECETPAWNLINHNEDIPEIWLEIKKPKTPSFPKIPNAFTDWIDKGTLNDFKEKPILKEFIHNPEYVDNDPDDEFMDDSKEDINNNPKDSESEISEFQYLKDFPEIQNQWREFVETDWQTWANEMKRISPVQKVYTRLHSTYLQSKKLGETYELILGLGLLSWLTPSNQQVKRHLLTSQAVIELEGKTGTLRVKAHPDGIKLTLEEDMLDGQERPNVENHQAVQECIHEIQTPWDSLQIHSILKTWVNSISSNSRYIEELEYQNKLDKEPIVYFSPAILLRKRSERNFQKCFEDIKVQLEQGVDIPFGIKRTVDVCDDIISESEIDPLNLDHQENDKPYSEPDQIYFPLATNDEQARIIRELNSRQGILVQGPPGTGKSHTIVNLISHLLATGKRVLVTSHTNRALDVLKDKIPNSISALCVNLLGASSGAIKEVENSVQGITDKQFNWDQYQNSELIDRLNNKIHELKKNEAQQSQILRAIRERETFKHNLLRGKYTGTASDIAKQISHERDKYMWIEGLVDLSNFEAPPISNSEATELLKLFRDLNLEDINETEKIMPSPEELISVDSFREHRKNEIKLLNKQIKFDELRQEQLYEKFKSINVALIDDLHKALKHLIDSRQNVLNHCELWVETAVSNIISERDREWKELLNASNSILQNGELLEQARKVDDYLVTLPEQYTRPEKRLAMISHAKDLLLHMESGKGLGFSVFKSKAVKTADYIIKEVSVNGTPCNNKNQVEKLMNFLDLEEKLHRLWKRWESLVERGSFSSYAQQVSRIEDLCEPLEASLDLYPMMENARAICEKMEGIPQPQWHDIDNIILYLKITESIQLDHRVNKSQRFFDECIDFLDSILVKHNVHSVTSLLKEALISRDDSNYSKSITDLNTIFKHKAQLKYKKDLINKLSISGGQLVKELIGDFLNPLWDKRLADFKNAWEWNYANHWLISFVNEYDETSVLAQIESLTNEIHDTTKELIASKAWHHCFSRLGERERQNLRAWMQAIKKIGKGTGKHAEKHRREARAYMDECKHAIPAWIMPLYRVVETVEANAEIFDVIIIDEASQSGPEALLLLFLGKQIIVVGDDEQISPDNIGVKDDDVALLQEKYLSDIERTRKTALHGTSSFFDLADMMFGGRIILQEHFRCMPEIIGFSNKLCYSNKPLKPLKQYPPDRLEPVITVHVDDGYNDGVSSNSINKPEAERIVEQILECCADPKYENKTMGVISLLGNSQSKLIGKMLLDSIGSQEIEKRNLICGEPPNFQGDERDIIFLSMVKAPNEYGVMRAETSQKMKRRMNVAASRAKEQMWLFHTPTINDFGNKECLRYNFLEYCLEPSIELKYPEIEKLIQSIHHTNRNSTAPKPFDSWFEIDVFTKIIDKGYKVIPQYKCGGHRIDLVVEHGQNRLAVECDGDAFHSSPEEIDSDIRRQRILERCGWQFWRVRGSDFYRDQDSALQSLWETLDRQSQIFYQSIIKKEIIESEDDNNSTEEESNLLEGSFNHQDIDSIEDNAKGLKFSSDYKSKKSIDDLNELSNKDLENSVVNILLNSPNNTCMIDGVSTKILKELEVRTRGNPRKQFDKKVKQAISSLARKGKIYKYKAKNERIGLV